jgi:ADP-heptose:LPS heptosyltransferase
MNDPIVKRVELWVRRQLIRLLGTVVRRRRPLSESLDFNASKVLCIRQDKIGDVLISTPLFAALKSRYPAITLDALLSPKNEFALENEPLIRKRWIYRKRLRHAISLLRSIRKERYDFAIDLMDNASATSTLLCLLAGARWNVGIAKSNSYAYDVVAPMLSRQATHIVDRIAQLLTPFKIDPGMAHLSIRYFTSAESDDFAGKFLGERGLSRQQLMGINISASGSVRFWGVANYRILLEHVCRSYPEYRPMVLYAPPDEQKARAIASGDPAIVLSPITESFDRFAALVKRLSVLITPDTSAVHLASAFQIPAVVLYVQSDKALRIWEPYGIDYEALVTDVDDLSTIPASAVIRSVQALLKRRAGCAAKASE